MRTSPLRKRFNQRQRENVRKFFSDIWDVTMPELSRAALKYMRQSRRNVPSRLLHFTSMAAVERVLSGKTLHLTRARSSNDPMELQYGLEIGKRYLDELRGDDEWTQLYVQAVRDCWDGQPFFGSVRELPDPHVCCLSVASPSAERSIPHWAMYGRSAAGAALVFDGRELAKRPNVDLVRVVYEPRRQARMMRTALKKGFDMCVEGRIAASPKGARIAKHMFQTLAHACGAFASMPAAVMKHPDFRFEDEWRLLVSYLPVEPTDEEKHRQLVFSAYASGDVLKSCYACPITPRDLKDIIIGPVAAELNEPVVKMLLQYNKFDRTKVRVGATSLRAKATP